MELLPRKGATGQDNYVGELTLRYRDGDGNVGVCHTLNNTVAASTRMRRSLK